MPVERSDSRLAAFQWMRVSGLGGSGGLGSGTEDNPVSGTWEVLAGGSSSEPAAAKKSVCDARNRLSENALSSAAEKSNAGCAKDGTGEAGNTIWVRSGALDRKSADDGTCCAKPRRATRSSSDGDAAFAGRCNPQVTNSKRPKNTVRFNYHPMVRRKPSAGICVGESRTMPNLRD